MEQDGKIVSDSSESNDGSVTGPPPPPLAPLSGANLRRPSLKTDLDDSNSTGNNSLASYKDTCSATGDSCFIVV